MSEKFSLKWNDFQSNVSKSFSILRNEAYLHDMTIVTDDNEQIAAHKLVLSACSEYFKNVFKNNKNSHPLLCLEGVSSQDISNVMDYIYNGELQIFQEDLDRFLSLAQRLKLEGLLSNTNNDPNEFNHKETTNINDEDGETLAMEKSKIENQAENITHERVLTKVSMSNVENISEVNEQIEQNVIKNLDGTYSCRICGRNFLRHIRNIRNHIETHLDGLNFNCPMCEKTFRSRHALAMHKHRHH